MANPNARFETTAGVFTAEIYLDRHDGFLLVLISQELKSWVGRGHAGGESMSRSASRSLTGDSASPRSATRTTSKHAFLSATAQAQGRTLSHQNIVPDLPFDAGSKWQRLKQAAAPGKASITKLVPQILKEPGSGGIGVAARRTIFGHARNFLQRQTAQQPEKMMLMVRSVVAGAKSHGHQQGFVTALHENAEEKKQERTLLQDEFEEGLESIDMSWKSGALTSSDLLEEAIRQVARLREMAEDSEADELLQQTHDTIDSCTSMLGELRALLDVDVQVFRVAEKIEESKARAKALIQDLQCDIDAMRDALAQARGPSRSPQKKVQFEETKSILSTFCDGANKLIEYSLARLDEKYMRGLLSEEAEAAEAVSKEDCDASAASEDFDGGALEELEEMGDLAHNGTRPAAGSLSDQDRPQSDWSFEQEQEQEQAGKEEQVERRDQHGTEAEELEEEEEEEAKEEDEENEEEFRELSAATPQTAVQLGEGAESVRGTGKIELEFHLEGAEEAEHSVFGIPSAGPSQAPGSPNRSEEKDDEEEAEPEQEAMDAVDAEEEEEPKKTKRSKKAKKAKRTPAAPVPQVKTRIEILPPVRLPALTRRNRKNTDDLDWNMEDLNAEELTLLTSVIDEDEPSNSLQSVSHDPAKERLWKSVFGLDDMSPSRRVQALLPPQRKFAEAEALGALGGSSAVTEGGIGYRPVRSHPCLWDELERRTPEEKLASDFDGTGDRLKFHRATPSSAGVEGLAAPSPGTELTELEVVVRVTGLPLVSSCQWLDDGNASRQQPPDEAARSFPNLQTGAAERRYNGGNIQDELISKDSNAPGTLAMANCGQPNTGGSQFFINVADNSFLDWFSPGTSRHPVFGKITSGYDVVVRLSKVETQDDAPTKPIQMLAVSIVGKTPS
ncbi:rotA [Symbiodinium sp. CCMP2592]|nr:rotA [Symbiodinium sp. CCMP2592]